MSLDTVQIRSLLNGINPVVGYREDLAIADVVTCSLFDTDVSAAPVVSSYHWQLIGRPETSTAGGAGPEPIELGTGATASFTVDNDMPILKDGGYKVRCTVNEGGPLVRQYEVILIRLSTLTLTDGRALRLFPAFEDLTDDASIATILQGWTTMLNRWLRKIYELATGGVPAPNSEVLGELLQNIAGLTLPQGTIMVLPGTDLSATQGDAADADEPAIVGVLDASTLDSGIGLVKTHGKVPVRFDEGLTLVAGQIAYLSDGEGIGPTLTGYATNVVPHGQWIVALGRIKDASTYGGAEGDLALVDLQIPVGRQLMTWEGSGRGRTTVPPA